MKNTKTTMLVMLLVFWAVSLIAQVTNVPPDITSGDQAVQAFLAKFSWVKVFIVPAVTVLVMGLRKVISAIPVQVWPWVAPFLGAGLDYAGAKLGFWTSSLEAGAAMGGLAVWFHQLGVQTKDLVSEGPQPSSGATEE
jgi:hypothetical protein